MTIVALLCGYNMVSRFACGGNSIMTAGTVSSDVAVVKATGGPGGRYMAAFTVIAAGYMGRVLTHGILPIVTVTTLSLNFIVIDTTDHAPVVFYMAGLTVSTGFYMIIWFFRGADPGRRRMTGCAV